MTVPAITLIQAWPAQMRKETAAAYVDAPSTKAFDRAVKAGTYPQPYKKPGEGERWLKTELDAALAKISSNPEEADDEFE